MHYNEFQAVLLARQLMENDEDEDDEEEQSSIKSEEDATKLETMEHE